MIPSTSWLSLRRTRTVLCSSMRCFRNFTSSKVCSGALVLLTFPAISLLGIGISIIASPRLSPQIFARKIDANRMESRRLILGIIPDHVLSAQVAQNFVEGPVKLCNRRVEPAPAGVRGQSLQRVFSSDVAAGVVCYGDDHDRIHDGVGALSRFARVFEGLRTRRIAAVADDDDHVASVAASDIASAVIHRIVERCAAFRPYVPQ